MYAKLKKDSIRHLFLAYTGYSVGKDGAAHEQNWNSSRFSPMLIHYDMGTGLADEVFFHEYLFLAMSIKDQAGKMKYIFMNEEAPANLRDWAIYTNELFSQKQNIDALYRLSLQNDLCKTIPIDVWIAIPYPHPKVFPHDWLRVQAVCHWIRSFLYRWKWANFKPHFRLKGFYWIQEGEYFNGPTFHDGYVMNKVNHYVRKKKVAGRYLQALWIPYQDAPRWDQWREFGFCQSILQPSSYFNTKKTIGKGLADAYENGQGVEMELDLGVVYDQEQRRKFFEYLNKGVTGGQDEAGRYFSPYMNHTSIAWYTGGWLVKEGCLTHVIPKLYENKDPLYESIWRFVKGTYRVKLEDGYPTGYPSKN